MGPVTVVTSILLHTMALPDDRIELSTFCLQDRCSTDELNGLCFFVPLRPHSGQRLFSNPTNEPVSVHKDLIGDAVLEAHPVRSHQEHRHRPFRVVGRNRW